MPPPNPPSNRIVFNVGGVRFETYRSTIARHPTTYLADLIRGPSNQDADGSYFIDRNGDFFGYVLDYYREGEIHNIPELYMCQVLTEFRFFRIPHDSKPMIVGMDYKVILTSDLNTTETQQNIKAYTDAGWAIMCITKSGNDIVILLTRHKYNWQYAI